MPSATLKMFLVHADPKRLRTVELSNWTGKAVAGPRSEFDLVLAREESLSSGVYFLTGIDPDTNRPVIYIGEAECIRDRVKSHLSKDYWNNIVFFISKDENMTKAHIRYIEGRLINYAKEVGRATVINNQSSGAKLPESDKADMEVFLEKVQRILPVLGVESFVRTGGENREARDKQLLYCAIKDVVATGYLTPNGMVVQTGSEAVLEQRASASKWPAVLSQRNKMIEDQHLIERGGKLVFVSDTEFSSPSAAAAVVHGGSANGLTAWKNSAGQSLKEIEAV